MNSNNLVVKETATIIWSVPGFSNQIGRDRSPDFFTKNKNNCFFLRLDSKSNLFENNCDGFVYIYLWSQKKRAFTVQYRISILDNVGQKQLTREYKYTFDNDNNRNLTYYIHREKCAPFLVNDTLKLHCEVDILVENKRLVVVPRNQLLEDSAIKTCSCIHDYQTLLESGKLSDFVIVVDGKKLHVHKTILAARSAVFAAMFEHSETKEAKEGQMVIKDSDMSVEVYELLIRYIYCGEIEMLNKYATELFVAADMYQLDHLKSICERFLIESIEIESVCSVVMLADLHNAHELKSKCIQFMIENYEQVMAADGWKQLMATNQMDLLAELFKISASLAK